MRGVCIAALLLIAGCSKAGNLKADNTYHGSPPAPVVHPLYDPFAAPGSNSVTWVAPTYNGNGTIVKPVDPTQSWNWEDYQKAPWFIGGGSGVQHAPGSF